MTNKPHDERFNVPGGHHDLGGDDAGGDECDMCGDEMDEDKVYCDEIETYWCQTCAEQYGNDLKEEFQQENDNE